MDLLKRYYYEGKEALSDRLNRVCFSSAFFSGIFSYAYIMINNINNHDNISMTPSGYLMGISSGRWMLTLLGSSVKKIWGGG